MLGVHWFIPCQQTKLEVRPGPEATFLLEEGDLQGVRVSEADREIAYLLSQPFPFIYLFFQSACDSRAATPS